MAIARGCERAGAAAISVLAEPAFFDGSLDRLRAVRAAVAVPLLRKDFIVDEYQLLEARLAGANAVLLIVAALDEAQLERLSASARQLGLAARVEVHGVDECERALAAGARIVGVNNRNLRTLEVDLDQSRAVASRVPAGVLAVSESGLRTPADLLEMAALGYRAFLIGERFMSASDPGGALGALLASLGATQGGPAAGPASRCAASRGRRTPRSPWTWASAPWDSCCGPEARGTSASRTPRASLPPCRPW